MRRVSNTASRIIRLAHMNSPIWVTEIGSPGLPVLAPRPASFETRCYAALLRMRRKAAAYRLPAHRRAKRCRSSNDDGGHDARDYFHGVGGGTSQTGSTSKLPKSAGLTISRYSMSLE